MKVKGKWLSSPEFKSGAGHLEFDQYPILEKRAKVEGAINRLLGKTSRIQSSVAEQRFDSCRPGLHGGWARRLSVKGRVFDPHRDSLWQGVF